MMWLTLEETMNLRCQIFEDGRNWELSLNVEYVDGVVGSNEDQVEAAAVEHGTDAVVDGHETFDVNLPRTKMCRPLHLLPWKIMKWLDLILPTKVWFMAQNFVGQGMYQVHLQKVIEWESCRKF